MFTEESAYEIETSNRLWHIKIHCYRIILLYETTVVNTNQLKGTKNYCCWNFIDDVESNNFSPFRLSRPSNQYSRELIYFQSRVVNIT